MKDQIKRRGEETGGERGAREGGTGKGICSRDRSRDLF